MQRSTDWFVRRVGVARATTLLCVLGLAGAALLGARPVAAVVGLTVALLGGLIGLLQAAEPAATRRSTRPLVVASILLLGLCVGYLGSSVRILGMSDGELSRYAGERVRAELVVTGEVRARSGWQSAVAEMRTGVIVSTPQPGSLAPEPVLLEIAPPSTGRIDGADGSGSGDDGLEDRRFSLSEGAIVVCEGALLEPAGPTASGFDQRSYLRRQGVEAVLRVSPDQAEIVGRRGGFWGIFDRIRARAREDLSRGPEARLDEVLQGMVMGDTVGIDPSWMDAFRRSGTAHMLSVSGLHVGCLAAIMLGLARLTRLSRGAGYLLAALAALTMIPFAGPSPPIIRATAMILVVLAGRWVGRGRDPWQVLALAACVVLALNPLSLFDVGFQLSFAAFGGMLSLAAPLQRRLHRLPAAVASSVAVSLAASLGTAPVSLVVFGQTSLVGALANVLVIPVLPFVTGLGMASVLSGHVWSGLSTAFDWLVAPANAWTVEVSRLFAAAPVLREGDIGPAVAAATAVVLVLPVAMALSGRPIRLPARLSLPYFRRTQRWLSAHRPRGRFAAGASAILVLICALFVGAGAYAPVAHSFNVAKATLAGRGWPDRVEVRVLDVGQGNAVLVRTPGGRALLFDGGPAGCGLGRQLAALGVTRLDVVVISHPHADHFAGLLECADDLEVDTLLDQTQVLPAPDASAIDGKAAAREARDYLELRHLLTKQGAEYLLARTGSSVDVDGVRVDFFAPQRPLTMFDGPQPWGSRAAPPGGEELNAASVVAVLRYGEAEFLLPGDAESEVLQRYQLPEIDVVVVPHHGSRGACSEQLLGQLQTKAAVVSVGEGNSFGHPDATTLRVLEGLVPSLARTDQAGWVCYRTDGHDLVLMCERSAVP